MSALPPAIFFVNGDINYPPTKEFIGAGPTSDNLSTLKNQLFLDDIMTKAEFDARVSVDPNYPLIVHLIGFRILVIVPEYYDEHNRHYADVVMFLHQGLVDVEINRLAWPHHGSPCSPDCDGDGYNHHHKRLAGLGPPGQCYDLQRINMYELIRAGRKDHHGCGIEVPWFAFRCDQCDYPFFCDRCHTFSGMRKCGSCKCDCMCGCGTSLVDNQGIKVGIVHAPNCDNEYHNRNFIHRK